MMAEHCEPSEEGKSLTFQLTEERSSYPCSPKDPKLSTDVNNSTAKRLSTLTTIKLLSPSRVSGFGSRTVFSKSESGVVKNVRSRGFESDRGVEESESGF